MYHEGVKRLTFAKKKSILILVIAELLAMSLWFLSSASLPDMMGEVELSSFRQALLISSVSAGFVLGALFIAFLGLSDRFDPRGLFFVSALLATALNLSLFLFDVGSMGAVLCRLLTGFCLAGVYPVGMKIAVGWGEKDRGLLVGLMVGALTVGSAAPYLTIYLGGMDWRLAVWVSSSMSFLGGVLILFCQLGPHHAPAVDFHFKDIGLIWTNKSIRYPFLGYLGHMWELYAMWAWIFTIASVSFGGHMNVSSAHSLASLVTFAAIALGGIACIFAGFFADRIGKSEVTIYAMAVSGFSAVATALSFGGPVWLLVIFILLWGLSVISDSAQFSALVADHAPPQQVGSLMTLQTALGFALTILTVQGAPLMAGLIGWQGVILTMALGPLFGIWAMRSYQGL